MKPKNQLTFLIYFVFFLSGMAGLIYEISWSRQIGLLFGHTVQAASTVLASYFAGMGVGYWIGSRVCRRMNPLTGYAIAEFLMGAWAIAIPLIIGLSESPAVSPLLSHPNEAWQIFIRGVFSFLLLLPATVSMGATLPLMAEFLSQGKSSQQNTTRITIAYSLNTWGALAGTLLSTFVLMVNVGVCGSSFIAVGLSWFCGATTLWLTKRMPTRDSESIALESSDFQKPKTSTSGRVRDRPTLVVLAVAFVSGFGTLALQVLFTRMFALVFHNSTYTFGVVVAVFLAALALGAALTSFLLRRFSPQRIMETAIGMGSLLTLLAVLIFVHSTQLQYFTAGTSFLGYIGGAILLVATSIGPAVVCLGMILPLVWAIAGASHDAGSVVGTLTSVNTIGAAAGALSASFFMLVYVGLWQSIVLIAFLFFLFSVSLLLVSRRWMSGSGLSILFVLAAVVALQSPEDVQHDSNTADETIVKRFHSSYGWIDVVKFKDRPTYKIRQNLHYRFGRTGGNVREFRQAHIPLLLHKNPTSVLFLGLGTGMTAGGAIPHDTVQSIDAVELIPEVVDAVRMLAEFNHHVIDHPKTTIHTDDARHFLLANPKQFDVIVSDLFVPWESESGYLYTVEHYRVARERLKSDGLFCQWLPLYQMGSVEFESIANSFAKVFPNTTVWWGQISQRRPVIALIGRDEVIDVQSDRLQRDIESVNRNRNSVDPNIGSVKRLWEHYAGDWKPTSTTGLNTDEFPRVEFLTPLSNRNRKLLSGANFESYYQSVFRWLSDDGASRSGDELRSTERRRSRQRLILFGNDE